MACAAGTPLADNMFIPLSEPMEVWHFDMLSPPEESNRRTLDVTFNRLVDAPAWQWKNCVLCAAAEAFTVERT